MGADWAGEEAAHAGGEMGLPGHRKSLGRIWRKHQKWASIFTPYHSNDLHSVSIHNGVFIIKALEERWGDVHQLLPTN